MKKLIFVLLFFLFTGCCSLYDECDDDDYNSDHYTNCCAGHGNVATCYKKAGNAYGYIMCEDGWVTGCSCQ